MSAIESTQAINPQDGTVVSSKKRGFIEIIKDYKEIIGLAVMIGTAALWIIGFFCNKAAIERGALFNERKY